MTNDDQLEAEIIAFLTAVNERLNADQRIRARTAQIRKANKSDPEDGRRYVTEYQAVYADEDVDAVFDEIESRASVVLAATQESEIAEPVKQMTQLTSEEREDLRKLLKSMDKLPGATPGKIFGLTLAVLGFGFKAAVRVAQLQNQATDLAAYCLTRFPPRDDD